jgi:hypothetical protein
MNDMQLEELIEKEELSIRSKNACIKANLHSLQSIMNYYLQHGTFTAIKNCGGLSNFELIRLCEKYNLIQSENIINTYKQEFSASKDIQLPELIEKEWLSSRAIHICNELGLTTLNKIINFYQTNKSFNGFENCGIVTNKELSDLCEKYLKIQNKYIYIPNELDINEKDKKEILGKKTATIKDKKDDVIQKLYLLNSFQQNTFSVYFEYIVSNLNKRTYNGLLSISNGNSKSILETIFKEDFNAKAFKNIGLLSNEEIDNLKNKSFNFISFLEQYDIQEYDKVNIKQIIKYTFNYIFGSSELNSEKVFDENDNLKLFSLLKYIVEDGSIFNETEKFVFYKTYSNQFIKTSEFMPNSNNLSKERKRQIRLKIDNSIENYFLFISQLMNKDTAIRYISLKPLHIIDNNLVSNINKLDDVNFNTNFFKWALGNLLQNTHSVLNNKWKSGVENVYIIKSNIYDSIDFEFLRQIHKKLNIKIKETYSVNFRLLISEYLKEESINIINEIVIVCEEIILKEFDLIVNNDGCLYFNKNTPNATYLYYYEILENQGNVMTLNEISKIIEEKYPLIINNTNYIRAILLREKEYFICIGKTSTYGLRKWEKEYENIKGGSIRNIIEEYLLKEDKPKYLNEIVEYVIKYRPTTYRRSILDNIRFDKKRFCFYENGLIGLKPN